MAAQRAGRGVAPARLWPLLATLAALGAWRFVHGFADEGGWFHVADQGLFGLALVTATAAVIRVTAEVRRSVREARTLVVIGAGGPAEVTVMDEGASRIALLGSGQAARRSLHAASAVLRDDERAPGIPSRAFFVERGDVSKLVVRASAEGHLRPIESDLEVVVARSAVLALLDGVSELHERGRVLGDIRPGSVLVGEDGRPVLLEMTPPVAAAPSARVSNDVARGAPPEPRDDVHAVGSLVYEVLSRRPSPAFGQLVSREPLGPTIDPVIEDILGRCLGPKDKTYGTAAELREALERTPWRSGLVAQLLARLETEPVALPDKLEHLRAHYFVEHIPAGGAGELSIALADEDTLEVFFTGQTIANAALRAGDKTIATLTRGRALIPVERLDPIELAAAGLRLVEPAGPVHELTTAPVPAAPHTALGVRAIVERAAALAHRGKEGVLAALRSGAAGAIPFFSTKALLEALGAQRDDDGPFPDVRTRIEDELIERALVSLAKPPNDSAHAKWLEKVLPSKDPVRAFLDRFRDATDTGATIEERAQRHASLLAGLGEANSRAAAAARRAAARLAAVDAPVVPVLSTQGGGAFLDGRASWLGFSSFAAAPRAIPKATRYVPELVGAVDQARELTARVAGAGEFPQLELADYAGDPRDLVLPLVVAVVQARGGRKPLPRAIGFAARVDGDGRALSLGDDLEAVVNAAIEGGMRLLFVAHDDADAARRIRADHGLDVREMAIEELPAAPLDEVLRFIEQRTAVYFPSVLAIEAWRARVILERARTQIAGARPDRALDQLSFLLAALARQDDARLANMKPVCLADMARCRNSRGHWRLALKAYDDAEDALHDLRAARRLDWLGAELAFELPNQKAACLLHAFAFDIAEPLLRANIEAKKACDLVSRHSLAKSQGTLGQCYLEWAIAGDFEGRADRLAKARELLLAAYEGIDAEEKGRNENYLAHLDVYCKEFEAAEQRYESVIAAERKATRPDRRNNLQFAELGLVLLETRRGVAGATSGFQAAIRRGEQALQQNAYQPPVRARLGRFVGTSLLELERYDQARQMLTESLEIFRSLDDAGAQLPSLLPVIELARLEAKSGALAAAEPWIAEAVARAAAVRRDVTGISRFAEEYATALGRDLEEARRTLAAKEGGQAARKLAAVRERIPY